MLNEAMRNSLVFSPLIHHSCPEFPIIQYADDTILFLDKNPDHARNLKWLLSCFEQISGMSINFHECDLVPININRDEAIPFAQILGV